MLSKLIRSTPHKVQLIEIVGRIDGENSDRLSEIATTALAENRTTILLDLHAAEFINSAGLRTLVQLYKLVTRNNGTLLLINPTDNVIRLLELVGLDSILTIYYDARWNAGAASTAYLPAGSREICYCL